MANSPNLGIGPSGLDSADEYLNNSNEDGPEKEAASEDAQPDRENEAADEEMTNEMGEPAAEDESDEPVPEPDDVAGQGGQTVVTTHSAGNQEVEIQCGATSCVFNRQHNCEAENVHISFNPNKGMRSAATQCDTYQTAPVGDEDERDS